MTTPRITPQQIYNLQEVDHRIDAIDAERARIEQRLANGVNRPDLTTQAERHYERAVAIGDTVRSRRAETERLRQRLAGLEVRLYSSNTSRRDLSVIQREVDSARHQMSLLDDMLNQMEAEQRQHQDAARDTRAKMQEAEQEWQDAIAELETRLVELNTERQEVVQKRAELAAILSPEALVRYERLRRSKNGVAIALVDNGRVCQGCRMTLSSNVIRQLRDKTRLVSCTACGRILYRP